MHYDMHYYMFCAVQCDCFVHTVLRLLIYIALLTAVAIQYRSQTQCKNTESKKGLQEI